MGGFRAAAGFSLTLSPDPAPALVSATAPGVSGPITLTYDAALVPGFLASLPFTASLGGRVFNVTSGNVVGNAVTLSGTVGVSNGNPDQVTYAPPPNVIIGQSPNVPAPGFVDEPVVI